LSTAGKKNKSYPFTITGRAVRIAYARLSTAEIIARGLGGAQVDIY
jgi:hypothetical protein